jgi:hypothetical protein
LFHRDRNPDAGGYRIKENIYHFPFANLDFSLEKIGSRGFSSDEKSKIRNGK